MKNAPPERHRDGFRPVIDFELFKHVFLMHLHRVLSNAKSRADLLGSFAHGNLSEHLKLTLAALLGTEMLGKLFGDRTENMPPSCMHYSYGDQQPVTRCPPFTT